MKFKLRFLVLVFTLFSFSSCLTVEKKIYTFEFNGKNSGKLTIKYVNIMSLTSFDTEIDENGNVIDKIQEDFETLINGYLLGKIIEEDYPNAKNIQKRLFIENDVLCGEVTMEFTNLSDVRLYQFDKKGPICFSICNALDGEKYLSSNGTLGDSNFMNVVFWPPKTKKLIVETLVTEPTEETHSLAKHYLNWKK